MVEFSNNTTLDMIYSPPPFTLMAWCDDEQCEEKRRELCQTGFRTAENRTHTGPGRHSGRPKMLTKNTDEGSHGGTFFDVLASWITLEPDS